MTLPDRVRIAGHDYAIALEDNEDFADANFGQVNHRTRRIRVNAVCDADQARATLLHEVLHAVDWAVDAELTEHQVSSISRGLFAVIRDNPDFATFLTTG